MIRRLSMRLAIAAAACMWLAAGGPAVWGIEVGQIDDFQNGTTQNWDTGVPDPDPPTVAMDSGPGGPGDHALLVTSNGSLGAGGRMVVINQSQWTGNYVQEGVGMIAAHVRNIQDRDLELRVAFSQRVASLDPMRIPGNSPWTTVLFPLTFVDLGPVPGVNADPMQVLGNVTELRLVHATRADFRGAQIAAGILVDNIIALPVGWNAGDTDVDGDVDSADLNNLVVNWTGALGSSDFGGRTVLDGDADGDMDVDTADLNALVLNWTGANAQPTADRSAAAAVALPEPSGGLLLAIGAAGVTLGVGRRGRRQPPRRRSTERREIGRLGQ